MSEQDVIQQQCTIEIEVNGKAYFDKDSMVDNLILFLGKVVSLKSPYTMNHSNHVRNLTMALAQRVEYPVGQLKSLGYAAALHDVGKIAISEYVINKPTLLTEVEGIMMRQHTVLGHKLIQPLCLDPLIEEVILYHHENYDGSGYPVGMTGDKIPMAARLIRITDTYDAMTSARPYRVAYSSTRAIELLKEDCRHFDPFMLDEFLKMIVICNLQTNLE